MKKYHNSDNKLIKILIFAVILIILFLIFNFFIDFKKVTRFSIEFSNVLSGVNIYIFSIFGFLFLLKLLFPTFINRYVIDDKNIQIHILEACIIVILMIQLTVFDSFIGWKYVIGSFVYLYGIVTICIKIFFNI